MKFSPVFCSVMALGLASFAQAAEKPNIIILYADDLGYGDVGCYGATAVHTPNIDRLAREGLRFTDGHAAAATCTPFALRPAHRRIRLAQSPAPACSRATRR